MLQYLVLAGAVIQLVGIYSYIRDTLRGETKPNRVSWLMWSIAPTIATAAALTDGVHWAVLPVFISGFAPFLVFLASFVNRNAYWKLEPFDYVCGALSALALVFWAWSHDPNVAIGFAILSDASAAVPTLVKSWRFPETETAAPFTLGIINALTSFAAVQVWTFSSWAFPTYLVIVNATIAFAITRHRLFRREEETVGTQGT
jgi:hypothetical protein